MHKSISLEYEPASVEHSYKLVVFMLRVKGYRFDRLNEEALAKSGLT